MFDYDKSTIRSDAAKTLGDDVAVIRGTLAKYPGERITIEGHCDTRGTDEYNQWLSEQRAQRTRDQFLKNGFTEDQLDAVGYGRTRPIDTGTTEEAHTRNRRVEFVIERELTPDLADIKELPQ